MSEKKLSSIVIAKNEERNIKSCLESQLPCIDEIVVLVDINSEDDTLEFVKSFDKVKFEVVEWQGYSKTKEYALSKTMNEWVLWIDADEIITSELCNELIEFKTNPPNNYSAYTVARKSFFLGKWIRHGGWYPSRATRLFNKNKASFSQNEVHEFLEVNGKIGQLQNDFEHHTDPNIYHYFEKFNIYTSLAAKELTDNKAKRFRKSDLILRPIFFFIKMYVIKRGFLDGLHGLILAVFSSVYVFTKYAKFWERKKL